MRLARRRRLAVVVTVGAVVVVVSVGLGTLAGSSPPRANGLNGYPSYLPRWTLHYDTDTPETGSTAAPALTSQGDTVRVVTPRWRVDAVVSGPAVPGEGLTYQTPFTTCTWTVTLSHATGPVPVAVADFDTIDESGRAYRLSLVPGGAAPPRALAPGRTLTFELRTDEAVGEGLLRWAPVDGRIVAKWSFVVEND